MVAQALPVECCEEHQPVVVRPLAHHCTECGKRIPVAEDQRGEDFPVELPHYAASLLSESGAIFALCQDGCARLFDSRLCAIAEALPVRGIFEAVAPVADNGYVFMPTEQGLYVLDLVAWAQRESDSLFLLHNARACSPLSVREGVVCGLLRHAGTRLIGWKQLQPIFEIAIPENDPSWTYAIPAVGRKHAYVVARSERNTQVFILELATGNQVGCFDLGGPYKFVEPLSEGVACLVQTTESRRIVAINRSGVETLVQEVPERTSWFRCLESDRRMVWGDGSYLWMGTGADPYCVDEQGNVRPGMFCGDAFLALSTRVHGSFLLSVDLYNRSTKVKAVPGQVAPQAVVVSGGRAVVSDGQKISSVGLP